MVNWTTRMSSTEANIQDNSTKDIGMNKSFTSNQDVKYTVNFGQSPWLPCEIIHLTCFAIAIYLLYALLHYRSARKFNPKVSGRRRKGGLWLENLCLMAIVLTLIRYSINQVLLITGWASDEKCSILLNSSIAMYFAVMHPIYLFLWVRQRIFYSNRALKHIYSRPIRILSWMNLICFVVVSIVSTVFLIVDTENSATGRVCKHSVKTNNWFQNSTNSSVHYQSFKVNLLTGLMACCIQISFLGLFLYPIMDNKLRAMRNLHQKSGSAGLIALIRRSFLLASFCIVTDVLIPLLGKPIHHNFPEAIFAHLAMYDINLIINSLSIIMTFRRWRIMLFPWYYVVTKKTLCPRVCQSRLPGTHGRRSLDITHTANQKLYSVGENNGTIVFHTKKEPQTQQVPVECRYSPIPDVIAPCVQGEFKLKYSMSDFASDSIKESVSQKQCSEPVTQISHDSAARKRSSSLTITSQEIAPGLRRSKSHAATLFLAKSRQWLKKR